MLTRLIIYFVGGLAPLWQSIGVNTQQLKIILRTKLLIDSRRVTSFTQNYRGKESSSLDVITSFGYFFIGLLYLMFLTGPEQETTGIALYLTLWLLFILITLITEFTDLLISTKDNYIILPQPVSDKTLAIARLLHIFLYLLRIVIAFILPAILYLFFIKEHSLGAVFLFFIQCLFIIFFAVFFVNIFYLFLLRYSSIQKFKETINYFRIGFIITVLSVYYILPNVIEVDNAQSFNVLAHPIKYFLPSVWITTWWSVLVEGILDPEILFLAILGLLVPCLLLYVVSQFLSQRFSQQLIAIKLGSGDENPKKSSSTIPNNTVMNWWKKRLNLHAIEEFGFEITWLLTTRSRTFKLKTYPTFAIIPAYFISLAMSGKGNVLERWTALVESDRYILLLYLAGYSIIIPILNLRFSEKYKASWLYYALPITHPGLVIRGSTKAVLIRLIMPFIGALSLITLAIWGIKTLDDLILAMLNMVLMTFLAVRIFLRQMPFSESWNNQQRGNYVGWHILTMITVGLMGFFHWFFLDYILILGAWGTLTCLALVFTLLEFKSIPWERINKP